jgi:hypothetical protein
MIHLCNEYYKKNEQEKLETLLKEYKELDDENDTFYIIASAYFK